MGLRFNNFDPLDELIERVLRAAGIPGAAIGIISREHGSYMRGYGYRDLAAKLPMSATTLYPIASTSKAFNATLLGTLVDDGQLRWDAAVQVFMPHFRLHDALASAQVTLRDLVTMRTGLPRHDWMWIDAPIARSEVVERMRHLEPCAGFRERFQYNNLTVTAAGHVAEVVTAKRWEQLIRERVLLPLSMTDTGFTRPTGGDFTQSYRKDARGELFVPERFACEVTAPSGGAIHSTINDMNRWVSCNLDRGAAARGPLINEKTLAEIHTPQIVVAPDPTGPSPYSMYAMGWFVDVYNGCTRLSHGGLLHDVHSSVMLFPEQGVGVVSFSNCAFARLASILNQYAFDFVMGVESRQAFEVLIEQAKQRIASASEQRRREVRVPATTPSHRLTEYTGRYAHPGYGELEIECDERTLHVRRYARTLQLEHWHYDAWVAAPNDLFETHVPYPFDSVSRMLFETNANGELASLTLPMESAVAPIRFRKL